MLVSERLKGEKIYLNNLSVADDFSRYCSWLKNPDVNQFLEVRVENEKNIHDLQKYVKNCNESNNTILWGIFNYPNKAFKM